MNYSNSQRAGVILYLTASLFGGYILTRRSTRKFLEKPIPEAELKQIVEAALCAPSGKNAQTWKFTVVTSRPMIEKLARGIEVALNRSGYNMYQPAALIIPSNHKDSPFG